MYVIVQNNNGSEKFVLFDSEMITCNCNKHKSLEEQTSIKRGEGAYF